MSARIVFKGKIAVRRLLAEQRAAHNLLLRHGGDDVLFEVDPAEQDGDVISRLVVQFGFLFHGVVRKLPRPARNDCHERALKALSENEHNVFATGWSLCDDDLWRPHSWVLRRGVIYEPTPVVREAYFGLVVNQP